MRPIARINRILRIENVSPSQPVRPSGQDRNDWEARSEFRPASPSRYASQLQLAACWLQAASLQRQALQEMRKRLQQLARTSAGNHQRAGEITGNVYELAEQWNELELLYFRCSSALHPSIETDIRSLRSHPAARSAGMEMNRHGEWRVDPIRLNQTLDSHPYTVIKAMLAEDGLLAYADHLLSSFEEQPAASVLDPSAMAYIGIYNGYGRLDDSLYQQGWAFSDQA